MTMPATTARILVVDDEEIVVSLVRDALEDEGYEILTASGGQEALQIAESTSINLLLTDIRMSPMNGIQLAERLKERVANLSIIFMTGYANLNSAKDAIRHGAVDYIMKPFELTEIRQAVRNAIDSIRKAAEERGSTSQLDRLSDLSQMLYEVGDKRSLISISLRFAMMQLKAQSGSIVCWDSEKTNTLLMSVAGETSQEQELPNSAAIDGVNNMNVMDLTEPAISRRVEDHPLWQVCSELTLRGAVFPWRKNDGQHPFMLIPIRRAEEVYGVISVPLADDATGIKESDRKLLLITASHLALSLENFFLLEQTRSAYSQLKELQDETIQLEKMATRGELSAEIAHELNNFLGVTSANISLLEFQIDKKNYEKLGKYIDAMNDNIKNMKKFTNNLMDFGHNAPSKETINFNKLLDEVVYYLRLQTRFEGVTIEMEPSDQDLLFSADVTHIQQLLYNLLNNAADATAGLESREIRVSVSTDSSNDHFTVSIEDTGVGIAPELLNKAFKEKFTTKEDGHGFGLMVCKRIIDGHNGKLDVQSTPGKGTTMSISFPLAKTQQPVHA